jgi:hypothetical protein
MRDRVAPLAAADPPSMHGGTPDEEDPMHTRRETDHPLAAAMRSMAAGRASGAVEVRGEQSTGTIWFTDGDITWARIAGRPFELGGAFDPAVLLEALSSPTADHDLGTALIGAGVPEDAVVRLAAGVIAETLTELFENRQVEVRITGEGTWFGSRCRFDAGHWADRFTAAGDRVGIDIRAGSRERLSA